MSIVNVAIIAVAIVCCLLLAKERTELWVLLCIVTVAILTTVIDGKPAGVIMTPEPTTRSDTSAATTSESNRSCVIAC